MALILGAGWSAAAGYPLARDLLRGPTYVTSDRARLRVQGVLDAFGAWAQDRLRRWIVCLHAS